MLITIFAKENIVMAIVIDKVHDCHAIGGLSYCTTNDIDCCFVGY